MGLFLFQVDEGGEIRTLSGTSLTRGIYEELEAREHYPMVSDGGKGPGTMGNKVVAIHPRQTSCGAM
jgi:hypothetical protein